MYYLLLLKFLQYKVELNVTDQLDLMTTYVNYSVTEVSLLNYFRFKLFKQINRVMNEASTTIHDEVETVKQSVEEYVTITNEQFAKENDFVKYQLAGKNLMLKAFQ